MNQKQTNIIRAQDRSSAADAQQWLVLFNCQAAGLAHCLSLQCTGLDVEFHDHASAAQNRAQIVSRLDDYERILVEAGRWEDFSLEQHENVWIVPPIRFHAYQPDMCWLGPKFAGGEGWPLGNCHSIIAYTAFTLGLDLEQALALYRDDVYAELGYYAQWDREAEAFYGRYELSGFDMAGLLAKWSRAGAFMYLPFHPKIQCLNDLARAILRRAGMPLTNSAVLPQDNLVGGPVFPVYPEIGRRLGVVGNYQFKLGNEYRLIDLPEYVERSYRHYDRFVDLTPTYPNFKDALLAARSVISKKAGTVASVDATLRKAVAETG